jgi:hypothetical protein
MNVQPNDHKRRTGDPEESPFTISTANLVMMGKPIGIFAGSEDFIMRIRNGKLVRTPRCQNPGVPNLGGDQRRYRRRITVGVTPHNYAFVLTTTDQVDGAGELG